MSLVKMSFHVRIVPQRKDDQQGIRNVVNNRIYVNVFWVSASKRRHFQRVTCVANMCRQHESFISDHWNQHAPACPKTMSQFITKHFGGIPKSLKDLEWIYRVNPNSKNSLPVAADWRTVAPGSHPQPALPRPTKISNTQYFKRDVRRAYPQPVVYSAGEL